MNWQSAVVLFAVGVLVCSHIANADSPQTFPFEDGYYCIGTSTTAHMLIAYPVIVYPDEEDNPSLKCVVDEFNEVAGEFRVVSRCQSLDESNLSGVMRELWMPVSPSSINMGGVLNGIQYNKCKGGFGVVPDSLEGGN